MQRQKEPVYRVKGLVRTSQMLDIWDHLADIEFEQTPTLKFGQTLQDKRCQKAMEAGKKRRKRKGFGQNSFLLLKSPNHRDMVKAHEVLAQFFLPGTDSSKL